MRDLKYHKPLGSFVALILSDCVRDFWEVRKSSIVGHSKACGNSQDVLGARDLQRVCRRRFVRAQAFPSVACGIDIVSTATHACAVSRLASKCPEPHLDRRSATTFSVDSLQLER